MSPAHKDSIKAKLGLTPTDGPYRLILVKGQERGAKVCRWQIMGTNNVWGYVYHHQQAVDLVKDLNDSYALWLMVRGTAAEKEHFP